MNCPIQPTFRSSGSPGRELPLRFYELGHDYRAKEKRVVHGLTRMRGFTQETRTRTARPSRPSEL